MLSIKSIKEKLNSNLFQAIRNSADQINKPTFVIGGYVRDSILDANSTINDVDIVIVGSAIELASLVQKRLKGSSKIKFYKTFGTAMIKWNSINVEFVSSRKESYSTESRNPKVKIGTLEDDQNRRDFTINSLAIQLNSNYFGKFIDPFNGLKDLGKKILKTPLDPKITYNDDPLRMLRAVRFSSQLNFQIDQKSILAIKSNSKRIKILSKERIVDELNKIIMTINPSKGFLLLDQLNLLNTILPELINLKGIEEIKGQKHKDNFYHTLEVLDNISMHTNNLWLRWAALLHDIGKAPTKKFSENLGWTFHGHEFVGAKMVYELFKRLKLPLNEKMKYVQKLVLMSSRPVSLTKSTVTDSAIRRLIFDAGKDLDDLITLCEADVTTKNYKRFNQYHENFKKVRIKIGKVEKRDKIRNFQPPISGDYIMNYYNLKPCKEVGYIKENIKEAILEGEIKNEYNAAHKLMLKLGNKLGLKNEKK
ncbi:MAG: HD domain-containing protein [Flavobacteriaceae bacterium]|nr:HD domain-containing protein [Flavobacteriaceae bacterium]